MGILDTVPELYGPEDPDASIPVAAGELFEWAWLVGELAAWLDQVADTTRYDFTRHFDAQRTPDQTAALLAQIRTRIGTLLDADHPDHPDRGQP